MSKRWRPTVSGEQEITLTFTVSYEATGNCYYDKGRVSGPAEDCYPPEGECEIEDLQVTIMNEQGVEIDRTSELGMVVMAQFDNDVVMEQMMETSPDDYRPDFERE